MAQQLLRMVERRTFLEVDVPDLEEFGVGGPLRRAKSDFMVDYVHDEDYEPCSSHTSASAGEACGSSLGSDSRSVSKEAYGSSYGSDSRSELPELSFEEEQDSTVKCLERSPQSGFEDSDIPVFEDAVGEWNVQAQQSMWGQQSSCQQVVYCVGWMPMSNQEPLQQADVQNQSHPAGTCYGAYGSGMQWQGSPDDASNVDDRAQQAHELQVLAEQHMAMANHMRQMQQQLEAQWSPAQSAGYQKPNRSEMASAQSRPQAMPQGHTRVQQQVARTVVVPEELQEQDPTTLILRNLPKSYTRDMLLRLLRDQGFATSFDFIYLPLNFQGWSGFGYAFVNFRSHSESLRATGVFQDFQDKECQDWTNPCQVGWASPLQGLAAHVDRYRNSPVMSEEVPDACRPMLFKDGMPIPFPAPTKRVRMPRRHGKGRLDTDVQVELDGEAVVGA
ncbi:unnamed protein product [Polarella glacialis]|uniref:Mei2-like C-terminal RNA recognition motif domain-containing protein n=1 Tax=Polarella glacialis TaxID=89957 RepID=A0A813DFY4_POLGL|nr:unnamed protein product [Polarella glacialis]